MHQRMVLDYDGIKIAVKFHRDADAEWIVDFMAPSFTVLTEGTADVEVELLLDPERCAELQRLGPDASGDVVDGLVLDNESVRFERWTNAPGALPARTALDSFWGVFYEVGPGPSVRISADGDEPGRLALMRVVREYAMHACLRGGDALLHAASLAVDGRAIVIAGTKSAGKTTSLTWALQLLEDARFIANDRVRLRSSGAGFEAQGMPTVLSFRLEGIEILPDFRARLLAERGGYYISRREARERPELPLMKRWPGERLGLAPARFAELLERTSISSAPAGALVFPEIVRDDSGLRAIAIDPTESAKRLGQALFGVSDLRRRSELFDIPSAGPYPDEAELQARARQIALQVPGYVWKVGSGAPRDPVGLQRFVRESLGAD